MTTVNAHTSQIHALTIGIRGTILRTLALANVGITDTQTVATVGRARARFTQLSVFPISAGIVFLSWVIRRWRGTLAILASPQMRALFIDITCFWRCGAAGKLWVANFRCRAITRTDMHIAFSIGIAMGANAALADFTFFITRAIWLARTRFVKSISAGTGIVTKFVFRTIAVELTKGNLPRLVGAV